MLALKCTNVKLGFRFDRIEKADASREIVASKGKYAIFIDILISMIY